VATIFPFLTEYLSIESSCRKALIKQGGNYFVLGMASGWDCAVKFCLTIRN